MQITWIKCEFKHIFISGSPREYLEHYIFPWLLPALEEMLRQAKKEKCLEVCTFMYY
jgi:hypothetical protein